MSPLDQLLSNYPRADVEAVSRSLKAIEDVIKPAEDDRIRVVKAAAAALDKLAELLS